MNPVLHEIASTTTGGWIAGTMTAVFLFFFTGWAAWAWWPANKARFQEASRMPLDDDPSHAVGGEA